MMIYDQSYIQLYLGHVLYYFEGYALQVRIVVDMTRSPPSFKLFAVRPGTF